MRRTSWQRGGRLALFEGYESVRALVEEMLVQRQISAISTASDLAFNPDEGPRFTAIREAHQAIAPMYWGPRISLEAACTSIRAWVKRHLEAR